MSFDSGALSLDGLEELIFSCFRIRIVAQDALHLPVYKGSTFRGAFGHTFRRIVCVTKEKACAECMMRSSCVYSYVFETPPPSDTRMMRKYPYAPHPFILEPPLTRRTTYTPGEVLSFGLTLIGRAIEYLPYFIYTFEEMGRVGIGKGRGKYRIDAVWGIEPEGGERVIYEGAKKTLVDEYARMRYEDLSDREVGQNALTLSFLTPTRIKSGGRLTLGMDFRILVRSLLRRLSLVCYFHCDQALDLDYRAWIERAGKVETVRRDLRWYDWTRYSGRQDTMMRMGGFVGEIAFGGDWKPFLPFVLFGKTLHVGKGTSFGLGKYEIGR